METVLGPRLEEEPPIGVKATYEEDQTGLPTHVQVREKPGSEPIVPLSALKPCPEPSDMPELLFERQQVGQPPTTLALCTRMMVPTVEKNERKSDSSTFLLDPEVSIKV